MYETTLKMLGRHELLLSTLSRPLSLDTGRQSNSVPPQLCSPTTASFRKRPCQVELPSSAGLTEFTNNEKGNLVAVRLGLQQALVNAHQLDILLSLRPQSIPKLLFGFLLAVLHQV